MDGNGESAWRRPPRGTRTETLPNFPNWLRQLCGFGAIFATIIIYATNIKSDVRDLSTRGEQRDVQIRDTQTRTKEVEERMGRLSADVADIKSDVKWIRRDAEKGRQP